MKNEDTRSKAEGDNDKIKYMGLTHIELIKLTRVLLTMPFGELTKLHKEKAAELGATSPSTVFIRALVFARLVSAQERKSGAP